jgi:hypothetical protein
VLVKPQQFCASGPKVKAFGFIILLATGLGCSQSGASARDLAASFMVSGRRFLG